MQWRAGRYNMEYLVWGAGRNTQMFVNAYYSFYFYKNPIKAIVDNDPNKWGKTLLSFPIISPGHIKKFPFDKILLCSHYILYPNLWTH